MRIALCFCAIAALACGGPMPPRGVPAFAADGAVEGTWGAAPLVDTYRVQLVDFESGSPVSEPLIVHGTRARLTGDASGVWVDALPGGRATGVVSAGAQGGSGAGWQLFAPWDFRAGALSV